MFGKLSCVLSRASFTRLSAGAAYSFTVDSGELDTAADFFISFPPLPGVAVGTVNTLATNEGIEFQLGGEVITGNSDWLVGVNYTLIPAATLTGWVT